MILSFEILLALAASVFYICDSAMLLFADELAIELDGRRVIVRKGMSTLVLGKRPFIPNPCTPHRPLMLASVTDLLADTSTSDAFPHFLTTLLPFKCLSVVLLLLFFPALPAVMLWFGNGIELLCWLVIVYVDITAIIYFLALRRKALDLSPREVAVLGVECVTCPPFAINIVRKLTLRRCFVTLQSIKSSISDTDFRRLTSEMHCSLDLMIGDVGADSAAPRMRSLHQQKAKLGELHDDN